MRQGLVRWTPIPLGLKEANMLTPGKREQGGRLVAYWKVGRILKGHGLHPDGLWPVSSKETMPSDFSLEKITPRLQVLSSSESHSGQGVT